MAMAKKSDKKKKPAVAKVVEAAASAKAKKEKPALTALRLTGAGSFSCGDIYFRKGEIKEVDSAIAARLLITGRFVEA